MICIRYRGGLGNQMFQYAFQKKMEQVYGKECIVADLNSYVHFNEHNGYELQNVFGIEVRQADAEWLAKHSPYVLSVPVWYSVLPEKFRNQRLIKLQAETRSKRLNNETIRDAYYMQQDHCCYEPQVFELDREKQHYLEGLWQNCRYFEDIFEKIRTEFDLKTAVERTGLLQNGDALQIGKMQTLADKFKGGELTAIHVRRGDFVGSKFDVCSMEYYRNAILSLGANAEKDGFCIFTDDAAYVKEAFDWIPNKEIIAGGPGSAVLDMYLMSLAHRLIISNSTFSFWSAALNRNHDVQVAAPSVSLVKGGRKYPMPVLSGWKTI